MSPQDIEPTYRLRRGDGGGVETASGTPDEVLDRACALAREHDCAVFVGGNPPDRCGGIAVAYPDGGYVLAGG